MKNNLFLIVISFFSVPLLSNAQLVLDLNHFYEKVDGINIYVNQNDQTPKNQVAGNPYEHKDFIHGSVISKRNFDFQQCSSEENKLKFRSKKEENLNEVVSYYNSL